LTCASAVVAEAFFVPGDEEASLANAEKVRRVADLTDRIQGSGAVLLTDFEGLSVADATELRRSLRQSGARFSVVKNTLMMRAAAEAGAGELQAVLTGPTAVAFVDGDVAAVAKSLAEAARRFPRLGLKGAFMEGRVLFGDEARALADLEPRPVLLSTVAGLFQSDMVRAATALQALQGRFLSLLEAYREKVPAAEAEPEAEAQPEPGSPAETGAGSEASTGSTSEGEEAAQTAGSEEE
jgi:large subunit ribosomal protein L10